MLCSVFAVSLHVTIDVWPVLLINVGSDLAVYIIARVGPCAKTPGLLHRV